MSERYSNKRGLHRKGGRFTKLTASAAGIGECLNCGTLTVRVYDGDAAADQNGAGIDPRKFRQRCFNCEPRTEAEQATLAAKQQEMAAKFNRLFKEAA